MHPHFVLHRLHTRQYWDPALLVEPMLSSSEPEVSSVPEASTGFLSLVRIAQTGVERQSTVKAPVDRTKETSFSTSDAEVAQVIQEVKDLLADMMNSEPDNGSQRTLSVQQLSPTKPTALGGGSAPMHAAPPDREGSSGTASTSVTCHLRKADYYCSPVHSGDGAVAEAEPLRDVLAASSSSRASRPEGLLRESNGVQLRLPLHSPFRITVSVPPPPSQSQEEKSTHTASPTRPTTTISVSSEERSSTEASYTGLDKDGRTDGSVEDEDVGQLAVSTSIAAERLIEQLSTDLERSKQELLVRELCCRGWERSLQRRESEYHARETRLRAREEAVHAAEVHLMQREEILWQDLARRREEWPHHQAAPTTRALEKLLKELKRIHAAVSDELSEEPVIKA